ncbi:MAG: hypothetical protein DLM65_08515, partial [Candidatus Aeolococcus gillhamiae]
MSDSNLFKVPRWAASPPARLLLFLVLLVPLIGVAPAAAERGPRAQAALLALAAQQPAQRVSVIVQKSGHADAVEGLVARLGGHVTKDLQIINAFAAELPAGAALELAAADGVRYVSLDSALHSDSTYCTSGCVNLAAEKNVYPKAVHASDLWNNASNTAPYLQGQNIGVAVLDSGISGHNDLGANSVNRLIGTVAADGYGHGTHVAGIIGGNGSNSAGAYVGIAPQAKLVNVQVSDAVGFAMASDVIAGLQWVLNNKSTYNIRVANLSLNSGTMDSYNVDPIDA